jgi:hypothetical protein
MLKKSLTTATTIAAYLYTATVAVAASTSTYSPPPGMVNPDLDPPKIPKKPSNIIIFFMIPVSYIF